MGQENLVMDHLTPNTILNSQNHDHTRQPSTNRQSNSSVNFINLADKLEQYNKEEYESNSKHSKNNLINETNLSQFTSRSNTNNTQTRNFTNAESDVRIHSDTNST